MEEKDKTEYGAKDIMVLEGLDPVRKRPGMYIGTTGPDGLHHLIWEVLDNSIDEALGGFAKNIDIFLLPNNRVQVVDDGRGIPVEKHPQTKKSTLETVMTILHAGGKFGGKAYQVSGGLHGVGVSVVNALSIYLRVDVSRDGAQHFQEYSKGKPKAEVKKVGKSTGTGTSVIFEPDAEIFKEIKFDAKRILSHLRQQAYLTPGIKLTFVDTRTEEKLVYSFYFEAGIASYIPFLIKGRPAQSSVFYTKGEKDGIVVETAFQYTEDFETFEESYANNIFTPEGGTHLTGFRSALTRTLNDYAKKNNFLKGEEGVTGEDVREGLTAVISIKIRDPQFEGQTKAKLGSQEAKTAVEAVVAEALTDYLERNPQDGKTIIEKCFIASKARKAAKAARQTVLRKGILEGLALPGKLADCSSKDPEESELYIVEGESAGGSAKQARDRRFQAILPLRGKILNVERARLDRILDSKEVRALVIALGTAIAEDFDITKLRYHRIVIMTDADVDGAHIRALLLTLFYRYFRSIIENGYIYIAQPPLYRVQQGKAFQYAFSDDERDKIVAEFKLKKIEKTTKAKAKKEEAEEEVTIETEDRGEVKEGKIAGISIQRYKGLGEMNAQQLWETTMDPKNRIFLQVKIEDVREADQVFDVLMGDEVAPRKKFIQTFAKSVKNLDI